MESIHGKCCKFAKGACIDEMTTLRPNYYKLSDNKHDLFFFLEHGLLTKEECEGFYKGNIYKYLYRYRNKNGIEDLEKADEYLKEFIQFVKELKCNGTVGKN